MACRCAELCAEYGNCSLEHVDGLQNVQLIKEPPPPGVKERYRCPDCAQVWELWMVTYEGQEYPHLVKEGTRPGV